MRLAESKQKELTQSAVATPRNCGQGKGCASHANLLTIGGTSRNII